MVPDEYDHALSVLLTGLNTDLRWSEYVDTNPPKWARVLVSSVLVLTGPVPARHVVANHNSNKSVTAIVLTESEAIEASAVGLDREGEPEVTVRAVPLIVESIDVIALSDPWSHPTGRELPWPGVVTASAQVRGLEPFDITRTRRTAQDLAAPAEVVEFLKQRLHAPTT